MSQLAIPSWVSEGSVRKYHRAVAHFTLENTKRKAANQEPIEVTEKMLKEHYVKNAGLVLGEEDTVKGVVEGEEADMAERAEVTQGKDEPKKGKK